MAWRWDESSAGTGKGGGGLLLAGWGSWEEAALATHQAPPGLLRGTRGRGGGRAGAFPTHFSSLMIKRALHTTHPQAWTLSCREGNSVLSPSSPGHEWLPVDLLTAAWKLRKTATAVEGPSSPGHRDCCPRDHPAGGSGLSCPVLSERACDMTVTSLPTLL